MESTHKLIEDSFENWRGISLAGGRRIRRSVFIDVSTTHFLEPADIKNFEKLPLEAQGDAPDMLHEVFVQNGVVAADDAPG